ncbi:B12-binding domain-containing radical SAM protein [Paraliomyxa miuraensis]|uniref:B12-binding domain-containing radical SAM protein n=1 Tax=Paraliomyxa miuraensis TaxID=376150 RepID=UPI00225553E1|nr:radical SAM protein [Paraliomyxa miuraensis]MCX4243649.1 radical SAM protein [Paraliomyxa miuraensis]
MRQRKVAIAYVETQGRGEEPKPDNPWDVFSYGAYRVLAAAVQACPDNDTRLFSCGEGEVEALAADIEAFGPDVFAASCFMWSFPTFVEVAKRLRPRLPGMAIVFGGPCAHPAMFDLPPYRDCHRLVDALVAREGETVIASILALEAIDRDALLAIQGVMVPTPFGFRAGGAGGRPVQPLDEMPSPYRMGLSPAHVPGKIELFRGCPMSCAFCEWGVADDPSRVASREWLTEELLTFRRLGLQSVLLVDAGINLNGRAFRNLVAAESEVGLFEHAKVALELYPDYVREEHIDFLRGCNIHTVGVGLQTISPNTHASMGRRFNAEKFRRGMGLIEEVTRPTIDVIFGLPGDSPEAFWRTIEFALEVSDAADVFAYHALVLPDGLMTRAPEGCEIDFDPVTLTMRSCDGWSAQDIVDTKKRLSDLCQRHGELWYGIERGPETRAHHGTSERPPELRSQTQEAAADRAAPRATPPPAAPADRSARPRPHGSRAHGTSGPRPRRIALVCHDPWRHEDSDDIRPFNYGVRRIQAAILGHPALADSELALLESTSLDPAVLAAKIEDFDPDVIGVSAYVWSFPLLLEVCRRAKRARPDRLVVFGGPSSRPEMCALPQHSDAAEVIDVLVTDEGEYCIQQILLSPDRELSTLRRIPGLALHDGERWFRTASLKLGSPDVHPSPYQMGLVPSGITCEIESFRGCPLSCTFCEWGDTGASGRTFGFEYLLAELQALTALDAKGSWLVDAGLNLNARAFKNLSRAEAEVGALKKLGNFRCEIYPSHTNDEHLRFLEDTTAVYAGIGLQSFDPQVLKGVSRKFDVDRFNRVVHEVGAIVPEATVEVMMGLPGDTPDNFRRTVERVRTLPVNVRVFHTLVLPGALMTKAPASFDLVYDPFDLRILSCQGWSRKDIEAACQWLDDQVEDPSGEPVGTWRFFRPDRADRFGRGGPRTDEIVVRTQQQERQQRQQRRSMEPPPGRPTSRDVELLPGLREAVQRRATATGWSLVDVVAVDADVRRGLLVSVERTEGSLTLRVVPAVEGQRHYKAAHGLAYSYERAQGNQRAQGGSGMRVLDVLIEALHPLMRAALLGYRSAAKGRGLAVLPERREQPVPPKRGRAHAK